MSASQPATPLDVEESIKFHLNTIIEQYQRDLSFKHGEAAASGASFSSRYYLVRFEIGEKYFRSGIDLALGQCRRAERITKIDPATLRQITGERLTTFLEDIRRPLQPRDDIARSVMPKRLPRLDEHLAFALRQYDVGLLVPPEPETPLTMNNSLTIGVMSGGMLQQGTAHSTQSATDSFNAGDVTKALETFAAALKAATLPTKQLAEIDADIGTIRAQLAKDQPSPSILREAGKSLRNLVEGVGAGMLTGPAMQAGQELFRVLGLL